MRQRRADDAGASAPAASPGSETAGASASGHSSSSPSFSSAAAAPPPPPPPPRWSCQCGFIPRPPRVLNIVSNEAMERFAFYGIRAILVLYLKQDLGLSDAQSVTVFSLFSALA